MIRLTATGAVSGDEQRIKALSTQYQSENWVMLPQLLDAALLERVQGGISTGQFIDSPVNLDSASEESAYSRQQLAKDSTGAILNFVLNSQELFEVIRSISACDHIGSFIGRVYRMQPGGEDYIPWHDDLWPDRLVALSLNLSPKPYVGGALELRNAGEDRPFAEIANQAYGDAIVFRIDPGLQHRVTGVGGSEPRTSFAGWFRARPEISDVYHGDASF